MVSEKMLFCHGFYGIHIIFLLKGQIVFNCKCEL